MKSEISQYCRELFSLTQKRFNEIGQKSEVQITTSNGHLVEPESHSLRFRLGSRIIDDTTKFIEENPAAFESLKTNKDALAGELAKQLAKLPQKRLGGDEIYTKKVRALDIPVVGQVYHAAYAKVHKMQNIATPEYDNYKEDIKDIIQYSLRKHSDFESPTVTREVENLMHEHPGKLSDNIARKRAESDEIMR